MEKGEKRSQRGTSLRLICDRDEEIENFIPEEYWTIQGSLKNKNGKKFKIRFYGKNNKKLEIHSKEEADEILSGIRGYDFIVNEVKRGSRVKNSGAPFTTSTLQQEASKILGFASNKTMRVAQQLYEGVDIKGEGTVGIVSYIRTDSVRISDEAYEDAKDYILSNFDENYMEKERKQYKVGGRAQDAHEAIRPTSSMRTPSSIKESLTGEQFKLYKLIWERFIASQMSPAVYTTMSVKLSANEYSFRASGSVLKFDGYLAVYKKNEEKEEEVIMPEVEENEIVKNESIVGEQHFTQPPARYTEAMLIKTLEEIGVGRPSTYAPTISTITARGYVTKENKVFYKTELGEIVNDIVKNNFENVINVDFTADMEKKLDEVEEGKVEWKEVIREFYPPFEKMIETAEEKIDAVEIEDEKTDIICENCGRNMVIKYGRFGKFLACPGFPECRNTKPFYEDAGVKCPDCGGKVFIKKTKKGRKYYGCENSPECEFMSWNKPTGDKCPECGSYLVEKGTKKLRIACSNSECGYSVEKADEEKTED